MRRQKLFNDINEFSSIETPKFQTLAEAIHIKYALIYTPIYSICNIY